MVASWMARSSALRYCCKSSAVGITSGTGATQPFPPWVAEGQWWCLRRKHSKPPERFPRVGRGNGRLRVTFTASSPPPAGAFGELYMYMFYNHTVSQKRRGDRATKAGSSG